MPKGKTLGKGLVMQAGISGGFEKEEDESQGEKRGSREMGDSSVGLPHLLWA